MVNKITISELRTITENFFDFLEKTMNIKEVEITETYYWNVLDGKYDVDNQPQDLGIGNLLEDLDFLKSIVASKDAAVAPNLAHLSPILDYISSHAKHVTLIKN